MIEETLDPKDQHAIELGSSPLRNTHTKTMEVLPPSPSSVKVLGLKACSDSSSRQDLGSKTSVAKISQENVNNLNMFEDSKDSEDSVAGTRRGKKIKRTLKKSRKIRRIMTVVKCEECIERVDVGIQTKTKANKESFPKNVESEES